MATTLTDSIAARFAEMSRVRRDVGPIDDSPAHITAPTFPIHTEPYPLQYSPPASRGHSAEPIRERTIYIGPSSRSRSPQSAARGGPLPGPPSPGSYEAGVISTTTNVQYGTAVIGSPPAKRLASESRNDRFVFSSTVNHSNNTYEEPYTASTADHRGSHIAATIPTRAPSAYSSYSAYVRPPPLPVQEPYYRASSGIGGGGLGFRYGSVASGTRRSSVGDLSGVERLHSGSVTPQPTPSSSAFVYRGSLLRQPPAFANTLLRVPSFAAPPSPIADDHPAPTMERGYFPAARQQLPGGPHDNFDRERASLRVERARADPEECPPGPRYRQSSPTGSGVDIESETEHQAVEALPLFEAASDPTPIERAYPHSSSAVRRTVANFNGLMIPMPSQLLPVAVSSVNNDTQAGGVLKRHYMPGSSNPFSLVEVVCLCRELRGLDGTAKSSVLAPSPPVNAAFVNILLAGADMALYTTSHPPQIRFVRIDVIREKDGQFVPVIAWSHHRSSYQASGHIALHELVQISDAHGDCPAYSRHITGRTNRVLDADNIALRINGETGGTGIRGPVVGGGRASILSSDNCVRMLFVGGVELCWIALHSSVAQGWVNTLRYILDEIHGIPQL